MNELSPRPPTPSALNLAVFEHVLAVAGWRVRLLEVDFGAARVHVEFKRLDGRVLTLVAEARTARIDRELETITLGRQENAKRGARLPLTTNISRELLWRDRFDGPRAALRFFCDYVADNPAPGRRALTTAEVRALFAPAMQVEWNAEALNAARMEPPDGNP